MPRGLVAVDLLFLYKKTLGIFNQCPKIVCPSVIFIAINLFVFHSAAQDQKAQQNNTEQKNKITIDEMSYDEMIQNQKDGSRIGIPPYRNRRKTWGATVSAGYSFWQPYNYRSFFNPEPSFQNLYGSASIGYISLLASVKLNHPVGALSLGLGGGYYKNKGGNDNLDLSIFPLVVELAWTVDNIMSEPYVAPYAALGLAYIYFREEQTAPTLNPNPNDPNAPPPITGSGTTQTGGQFALYYDVGLLIQLDWLEGSADASMYHSGIENAYIKVGITSFFKDIQELFRNSNNNDRDFTNDLRDLAIHVGLLLEF